MSLLFSWRSNTTSAYYAPGGELSNGYGQGVSGLGDIQATAPAGCIGSSVLNLNNSGFNSWREWGGIGNAPTSKDWTVNYRFSRGAVGTLTSNDQMFNFGGNSASYFNLFAGGFQASTDRFVLTMRNQLGQSGGINISVASFTFNTLAMYDLTMVGQQSTSSSVVRVQCYMNGSSFGAEQTFARGYDMDDQQYPWTILVLGRNANNNISSHYANELLLFNTALSSASIASAFVGESRSSFYSTTANQPFNSTDPGVANVNSGTAYTFKGTSLTGTLHDATYTDPGIANVLSGTSYIFNDSTLTGTLGNPTYTDPGVSNVLSGTSYIFNDSTLTGTYNVPDYTDPGIANVASGTEYIFNDATLTGTLSVPVASTGPAGTVPLNEIKEQIRYSLFINNTSTGAPAMNLSTGLAQDVRAVLKINPEKLGVPDSNILPAVTVFIDSKDTEPATIAVNGLNGKRKGEIDIKVAGIVWEPFTTNMLTDPADDQCELLMENVERVLRSYDTLGGNVRWQFPTGITYHNVPYDEQAHLRIGIMNIKATLYY